MKYNMTENLSIKLLSHHHKNFQKFRIDYQYPSVLTPSNNLRRTEKLRKSKPKPTKEKLLRGEETWISIVGKVFREVRDRQCGSHAYI